MLKKYSPTIFFIVCLVIYGCLANILRGGPDFNDETEKLVGAMMIADGMRIYKDMFAHHGPLSYMIAHLFYFISSSQDIAIYRFIPILFSIFSISAIALSPAIKKTNFRLFAAGLFVLGLALMQAIYGLMLGMYQIYAGHLIVCALALLIVPIIVGNKIPRLYAFLAGICMGFTFFSGYSFVITCGLLMLICIIGTFLKNEHQAENKTTLYNAIFGVLASICIVGIYLFIFGDIKGYAVYHFYFNQIVYAKFSNYRPLDILHFVPPIIGYFTLYNPPSSWLSYVISSSVSIFVIFLIISLKKEKEYSSKILFSYFAILLMAIIFSDPRAADDFQMNTLVIVVLGFIPLITCVILDQTKIWKSPLPLTIIVTTLLLFLSFIFAQFNIKTYLYNTSPKEYYQMNGSLRTSETKEFQLLRTIVDKNEQVQQFPYNANFYIQINRMPASGNYYYLPWQNKYFQDPVLGYKIDICSDMENKLPKIIYYHKSVVWVYDTSTYLGCVEALLKKKYIRTSIMQSVWIRADVIAARDDLLKTAIIPDNFDASWMDKQLQERLKKAKLTYKVLSVVGKNICLHQPNPDNTTILSGDCDNKNVLKITLRARDSGLEMITLPDMKCIEVEGAFADENKTLRTWPCQGISNQNFSVIPSDSGFRLLAKNSNLCLSLSNGLLVQVNCKKSNEWRWKDIETKTR